MALRQIPKNLLHDSALVFVPVKGEYGGTFSKEAKEVRNVRLERKSGMNISGYVQANGTYGRLFVDAVNSIGAFEIPVGSKVLMNDSEETHVVTQVETFIGIGGKVHHWEVSLS